MEFAYLMGGGAPLAMKFTAGETFANRGVVALQPAAGGTGLAISTTTSFANAVGVTLDTATYQAGQNASGADQEVLLTVIVNPNAIWSARMSGGATEGTVLSTQTVTTASTDGLTVTTAAEWSSPTFDEGSVWGLTGANKGILRKITSVSATAGTVILAFPRDIAVGDTFLRAPYTPLQTVTLQATTNLYEADASIAVGTGGSARILEIQHAGAADSHVLFMLNDHAFRDAT